MLLSKYFKYILKFICTSNDLNFIVYKNKYLFEHSSPILIQVECPLPIACFGHDVDITHKKKLCDQWTYILECV